MPEIIPFKGNCRGYGIAILAVLIPENLVGMEEEEELSYSQQSFPSLSSFYPFFHNIC